MGEKKIVEVDSMFDSDESLFNKDDFGGGVLSSTIDEITKLSNANFSMMVAQSLECNNKEIMKILNPPFYSLIHAVTHLALFDNTYPNPSLKEKLALVKKELTSFTAVLELVCETENKLSQLTEDKV